MSRFKRFRYVAIIIAFMASTYGMAYFSLLVEESWVIGPVGHHLLPTLVVLMMIILGGLTVLAWILFKRWNIRLFLTLGVIVVVATGVLIPVQRQQDARVFEFENSSETRRFLVREQPSWLSTELDFFALHPLLGWQKVGMDESTNSVFRPFSDGDYTLTWLSAQSVQVTWLFDDDDMTYRSVTVTWS